LAIDNEARAIKGRSGKLGKRAEKVNVLTRGDLPYSFRVTLAEMSGWDGRSQQRPKYQLGARYPLGRAEQ
jgi:hypothetical protein